MTMDGIVQFVLAALPPIASTATLVGVIAAIWFSYHNGKKADEAKVAAAAAAAAADKNSKEIVATKDGIYELGERVDGRLSELLKVTSESAHQAGRLEGEQAQRDRSAPPEKSSR